MNIVRTPLLAAEWLHQQVQNGHLSVDSRQVMPGDGFIAWPGAAVDGRRFVEQVLSQGAAACLVEEHEAHQWPWYQDPRVALYPGLKTAMAAIAAHYYGFPSEQLDVLAITGTNGKTSTAWWMAQALTVLDHACGMIGTLGVGTLDHLEPSALTTPDPIRIHQVLRSLVGQGVKACAMEASSIGLAEHRFDNIRVKVALLTNVTQDHLDYHHSMQAYWQAKRSLFDMPGLQSAVINVDDAHGAELAAELAGTWNPDNLYTYSRLGHPQARLQARNLAHTDSGIHFVLAEGAEQVQVQTHLMGDYNVSNLLGIAGALRAMGYSLHQIAQAFSALTPVPGRMQNVFTLRDDVPKVVVDYAHTPDALANVLQALHPLAQARGGRLWCVFGCGGNRDATKRPLMGHVVQQYADDMVVTSDNPRHEDASDIIQQVVAGIASGEHVHVEVDRRQAIAWALQHARAQDVVVLAGKGHESYQEVNGVRYPFSDAEMASQVLNALHQPDQKALPANGMMTLRQAQALLQSQGVSARLHGDGNMVFSRVHTDTRTLQAGDLFVALKGEIFDAHDFLAQAKEQGAVAVLAQRGIAEAGVAGLEVADSLKALGALASGWRACWSLPVIAVTGSNGKTTTTQMIASILRLWKGTAALSTQGNLNNAIGLPLMVLRLRAYHEVAVFELGMNHPGEIDYLATIVKPTIALVNNAQREHQEFMKTVEAVAHENGRVIDALPQGGTAVFPADDAYTPLWKEMAHGRSVATFALDAVHQANVTAQAGWDQDAWQLVLQSNLHVQQDSVQCRLHCAGLHNVKNALAATACAQSAGVPLQTIGAGLDAFVPVSGRSQVEVVQFAGHKVTLINDAYNANPDSVRAAIDVLAALPQPALLVLGEMGEAGTQGAEFHREVGAYARERGVAALWGAGPLVAESVKVFGDDARHFDDAVQLAAALSDEVGRYASILVKGSRVMRMERVVQQLRDKSSAVTQGGAHAA